MIQQDAKRAAQIIRKHYGLNRPVTAQEVSEISNLIRKQAKGLLDYSQEQLYCKLHHLIRS